MTTAPDNFNSLTAVKFLDISSFSRQMVKIKQKALQVQTDHATRYRTTQISIKFFIAEQVSHGKQNSKKTQYIS